jgi:hypothetical protein
MVDGSITILRGVHPLEVSARYLARKVNEELIHRGYLTYLLTIPFKTTHFAHALGSTSEFIDMTDLMEKYGVNPSQTFFYNFHNYILPEGFGQRKSNFDISETNTYTSLQEYEKMLGNIWYEFEGVDEEEGWRQEWYNDGLNGEGYKVINSILYEIPAFYKKLPKKILERMGGRYIAASSGIYDDLVVDFERTKNVGLLDDNVINVLTDNILRIHKEFSEPVKILKNY